jgi:hypothetical protein
MFDTEEEASNAYEKRAKEEKRLHTHTNYSRTTNTTAEDEMYERYFNDESEKETHERERILAGIDFHTSPLEVDTLRNDLNGDTGRHHSYEVSQEDYITTMNLVNARSTGDFNLRLNNSKNNRSAAGGSGATGGVRSRDYCNTISDVSQDYNYYTNNNDITLQQNVRNHRENIINSSSSSSSSTQETTTHDIKLENPADLFHTPNTPQILWERLCLVSQRLCLAKAAQARMINFIKVYPDIDNEKTLKGLCNEVVMLSMSQNYLQEALQRVDAMNSFRNYSSGGVDGSNGSYDDGNHDRSDPIVNKIEEMTSSSRLNSFPTQPHHQQSLYQHYYQQQQLPHPSKQHPPSLINTAMNQQRLNDFNSIQPPSSLFLDPIFKPHGMNNANAAAASMSYGGNPFPNVYGNSSNQINYHALVAHQAQLNKSNILNQIINNNNNESISNSNNNNNNNNISNNNNNFDSNDSDNDNSKSNSDSINNNNKQPSSPSFSSSSSSSSSSKIISNDDCVKEEKVVDMDGPKTRSRSATGKATTKTSDTSKATATTSDTSKATATTCDSSKATATTTSATPATTSSSLLPSSSLSSTTTTKMPLSSDASAVITITTSTTAEIVATVTAAAFSASTNNIIPQNNIQNNHNIYNPVSMMMNNGYNGSSDPLINYRLGISGGGGGGGGGGGAYNPSNYMAIPHDMQSLAKFDSFANLIRPYTSINNNPPTQGRSTTTTTTTTTITASRNVSSSSSSSSSSAGAIKSSSSNNRSTSKNPFLSKSNILGAPAIYPPLIDSSALHPSLFPDPNRNNSSAPIQKPNLSAASTVPKLKLSTSNIAMNNHNNNNDNNSNNNYNHTYNQSMSKLNNNLISSNSNLKGRYLSALNAASSSSRSLLNSSSGGVRAANFSSTTNAGSISNSSSSSSSSSSAAAAVYGGSKSTSTTQSSLNTTNDTTTNNKTNNKNTINTAAMYPPLLTMYPPHSMNPMMTYNPSSLLPSYNPSNMMSSYNPSNMIPQLQQQQQQHYDANNYMTNGPLMSPFHPSYLNGATGLNPILSSFNPSLMGTYNPALMSSFNQPLLSSSSSSTTNPIFNDTQQSATAPSSSSSSSTSATLQHSTATINTAASNLANMKHLTSNPSSSLPVVPLLSNASNLNSNLYLAPMQNQTNLSSLYNHPNDYMFSYPNHGNFLPSTSYPYPTIMPAATATEECKPPIIAKRRAPHTRVASMPKRRAPNSSSSSNSGSESHSNSYNDDNTNNSNNNNISQWKSTGSPMDLSNYVVKVGSSDNGDDAAVNDDDKDVGDHNDDDDEIDDDAVKKSTRRNTIKSKDNHKPKSKVVPKTVAVQAITTKGKESAKTSVTKESSSKSVRFA